MIDKAQEQSVLASLRGLVRQSEDYIWRPADDALTLIAQKNMEIAKLRKELGK